MRIISSAELRNNYRKVADDCVASGEPTFITNNGEGELVVMSIQTYREERARLRIEHELLRIEAEDAVGKSEYITLADFEKRLDNIPMVAEKPDDPYDFHE